VLTGVISEEAEEDST